MVSIDDYIVKEKLAVSSWDGGIFDRRRLEEQVLQHISEGNTAYHQKLLWDSNTLSAPISVPAVDYLIVEGISAYHPDIEHYYRCKIWVDTPPDLAQQRGHARDSSNENAAHWELWAENDRKYFEQYHPNEHADYIISNR